MPEVILGFTFVLGVGRVES